MCLKLFARIISYHIDAMNDCMEVTTFSAKTFFGIQFHLEVNRNKTKNRKKPASIDKNKGGENEKIFMKIENLKSF